MDRELPVSVWPEWKIIEKIGEGSFGKVYKAERTEKGHSFYSAIKIIAIPASRSELNSIRSETQDEQSARDYFENVVEECIQEVSTMEHFRGNSHVVSVEDFKVVEYLDEIGWDISIRMEYLTSFMDYCAAKNLTEKEVMKLGIDLCKALEYCRQLNIIHRDIKPENIFVSRFGDFKLGDFGIARELERTMSGFSKKGTYSYMAPEIYRGEQYDNRADIYSLGLVLYKLMNHNRLPFLNLEKQLITYRDKENALTRRMSGEKFPKPADAGEGFNEIIRRACAYDPEKRYQNPEEFRRDMENLIEGRSAAGDTLKTYAELSAYENKSEADTGKASGAEEERPGWNKVSEEEWPDEDLEAEEELQWNGAEEFRRTPGKRRRKKNSWSPWTIAVIVVSVAACIIFGVYLKLLLSNDLDEKPQSSMSQMLEETEDYENTKDRDFSEAMQDIRTKATTIVNELDFYVREGVENQRLRYYNQSGEIMKVLVYPANSEDGVYEEYYYWNGQLFFAYIWTEKITESYYYENGLLIRWNDENGTNHDGETNNPEYVSRGEKYWNNSVDQLK